MAELLNQGQPDASPSLAEQNAATASVLYGDPSVMHRESLREFEQTVLADLGTPAEAKAAAAELTPILARFTTNPNDGRLIADAFAAVRRTPPTAERVSEWQEQSRQQLRDEYGDDAGVVLKRTQQMLAADPGLKTKLYQLGIGSEPGVVRVLAAAAQRMWKAGKLK